MGPRLFSLGFSRIKLTGVPEVRDYRYADDTTFVYNVRKADLPIPDGNGEIDLTNTPLGQALRDFKVQAENMGLIIHPDKSELVAVTGKKPLKSCYFELGGSMIREKPTMTMLGFTIDRHFSVEEFLAARFEEARRRIWIMLKLKKYNPPVDVMVRVYKMLVRSTMECLLPLTMSAMNGGTLNAARTIQKKCLKIAGDVNACEDLEQRWAARFKRYALSSLIRLKMLPLWPSVTHTTLLMRVPKVFRQIKMRKGYFQSSTVPAMIALINHEYRAGYQATKK